MSEDLKDLGFQSLDDLGFVSEDQLQQPKPTSKPGMLEAIARGGAQGLAFGGADEATAALESLLTNKTYKQALEESRRNYKAAEEAHPVASLAGNLGGGVLGAFGLGEALSGLGLMGKLAGTAAEAPEALTALQKMGQAAKVGAGYGALTGLGTSEESLADKPLGVAKDVASSTAMGGLTGGALGGLGHLGSKLAEEVGFIKRPTWAYKLGTEGKSLLLKSDIGSLEQEAAGQAKNVSDALRKEVNWYGKLKNEILDTPKKDIPTDLTSTFKDITAQIDALDPDSISALDKQKLMGLLNTYKDIYQKVPIGSGAPSTIEMSPTKIDALKRGFQAYTSVGENSLQTPAAKEIALNAVKALDDKVIDSLTDRDVIVGIIQHYYPYLDLADSKDRMLYDKMFADLKNRGLSKDIIKSLNSKMHDILTVQDLLNIKSSPVPADRIQNELNLAKLFSREAAETEGGVSARQKLSKVAEILHDKKLDAEQQKFPELFAGDHLKDAFDQASKAGEAVENLRYASGKIGSGPAAILGIADVATTQGANAIGYTTRWGNYLYNADQKAFQNMSSKIKNTSGENVLTKAFDKLSETSDINKKRAMLNTMMQTPIYRAMIHKFGDTIMPTSEENPSGSPTE